ncbi:MAG: DnaJ domain-containing protein [Candidatus Cloacimonetes bacterium]|nr:DnaJ domain-containing protein [Candidatus Cloacimonadota bacterium]
MSIADRIAGIAKSYYNSARDELEEGFEDLTKLYEKGELTNEIKKRVADLKSSKYKDNSDELSEDEVEQILNDLKYDNPSYSSRPKKKKPDSKIDKAYARLNVSPADSLDQIEKSYKKAMKKYHPDRYATSPEKLEAATKVAQMITEAYDTIKKSKK